MDLYSSEDADDETVWYVLQFKCITFFGLHLKYQKFLFLFHFLTTLYVNDIWFNINKHTVYFKSTAPMASAFNTTLYIYEHLTQSQISLVFQGTQHNVLMPNILQLDAMLDKLSVAPYSLKQSV